MSEVSKPDQSQVLDSITQQDELAEGVKRADEYLPAEDSISFHAEGYLMADNEVLRKNSCVMIAIPGDISES
jgi:hypothetical protein